MPHGSFSSLSHAKLPFGKQEEKTRMETLQFIRSAVDAVNGMVGTAMNDLTDEVINWHPGGTANTIAQLLAHMVTGQDLLVNDKLVPGGGKTLHESGWAERTGIPLDRSQIWQRDAWRLNLAAFDDFRLEVAAGAVRRLETTMAADLDRQASWIRGPDRPVALMWQTIFVNHGFGHCGEISAIKGMQGLKGLPI